MNLNSLVKLKKYFRSEEGTTAIEFSLLAIPFFMLVFGIIELSLMFASATLLEGATSNAARLVRTGQLQQNADPQAAFEQALCDYATVLIRCEDIVVEAQTMSSFSDFDEMAPTYDDDGNMESQGFDAGGSGDRILILTFYNYTMMVPFVGRLLAGPDNKMPFMSTIVLQTEPYEADF